MWPRNFSCHVHSCSISNLVSVILHMRLLDKSSDIEHNVIAQLIKLT